MLIVGKYRIWKKDQYNWVLEEKHIKTEGKNIGEEVYTNAKYYYRLETAAIKLLDNLCGEFDTSSVQEMIKFIEFAKNEITAAVEKQEMKLPEKVEV